MSLTRVEHNIRSLILLSGAYNSSTFGMFQTPSNDFRLQEATFKIFKLSSLNAKSLYKNNVLIILMVFYVVATLELVIYDQYIKYRNNCFMNYNTLSQIKYLKLYFMIKILLLIFRNYIIFLILNTNLKKYTTSVLLYNMMYTWLK